MRYQDGGDLLQCYREEFVSLDSSVSMMMSEICQLGQKGFTLVAVEAFFYYLWMIELYCLLSLTKR